MSPGPEWRRRESPGWRSGTSAPSRAAFRRPRLALAGAGLLLILAFGLWRVVGTGFLPQMDEGGFILDYWTPTGSSLAETDRAAPSHRAHPQGRPGRRAVHPTHRDRAGLLRHGAQHRRHDGAAPPARTAQGIGLRGHRPVANPGRDRGSRGAGRVRPDPAGPARRPDRLSRTGRDQALPPGGASRRSGGTPCRRRRSKMCRDWRTCSMA